MPASKGSAAWQGDLKSGRGQFSAGYGIEGEYSFRTRFEDGPGANPEHLIASAYAACFSMALSNTLAQAGFTPDSVKTEATVTMTPGTGITAIALVTVGAVPGIDGAAFAEHAQAAKENCPVGKALASVPEITLEASLAS